MEEQRSTPFANPATAWAVLGAPMSNNISNTDTALPAEVSLPPESDDGAGEVLASSGATLENLPDLARPAAAVCGMATYQLAMQIDHQQATDQPG
eukprot:jgi/Tetstr1/424307/TSEL_014874.t1